MHLFGATDVPTTKINNFFLLFSFDFNIFFFKDKILARQRQYLAG